MTPEQYQAVKAAFADLMDRPAAARARRLAGEPPAVRRAVEGMLAEADAETACAGLGDVLEEGAAVIVERAMVSEATVAPDAIDPDLPPAASEALPTSIGRYRVEGVLGRGGMGTVYAARQHHPDRRVAVKVVRSEGMGPELLARFRREAEVLGQLQHPGIAHVYEAGVARIDGIDRPYFAMELIDGERLDEHVAREHLGRNEILELVARIADAVQHAHQNGVIHRDLKPANVLVANAGLAAGGDPGTRTGTDAGTGIGAGTGTGAGTATGLDAIGRPVVLDFGVSRVLDDADGGRTLATRVGAVVGTLGYMAPEQLAPDATPADSRCDVYALGVMAFELLCGRRPVDIEGRSIAVASRLLVEQDAPRLGAFAPACRGDVETVVGKALERDRERRYASAAEFAEDLRRCVRDEPIAARPASTLYQLRKFARRNPSLVAGVATAVVALVAGFVAVVIQNDRVSDQRDAAERAEHRLQSVADFQRRIIFELDAQPMVTAIHDDLRQQVAGLPDADLLERMEQVVDAIDVGQAATTAFKVSLPDRARELLDGGMIDDPLVEADLRTMIGENYEVLRRTNDAFEQHWRAFELLRETYGFEDRRTLSMLPECLRGLQRTQRNDEAIALAEAALDAIDPSRRSDDPVALAIRLQRIASEPFGEGRYRMLQALRPDFESAGITDTRTYDELLSNLAYVAITEGLDPDTGYAIFAEHFEPRIRAGERDIWLLRVGKIIADAYRRIDRLEASAELYLIVYRTLDLQYGFDHDVAYSSALGAGEVYHELGRHAEADAMFDELERRIRSEYGLASLRGGEMAGRLAGVIGILNRRADADQLLDDTIAAREALGYRSPDRVIDHQHAIRTQLDERAARAEERRP